MPGKRKKCGMISCIVPNKDMPTDKNGMPAEVIVSPYSWFARRGEEDMQEFAKHIERSMLQAMAIPEEYIKGAQPGSHVLALQDESMHRQKNLPSKVLAETIRNSPEMQAFFSRYFRTAKASCPLKKKPKLSGNLQKAVADLFKSIRTMPR